MLFYKYKVPTASEMKLEDIENLIMERYKNYHLDMDESERSRTNEIDEVGYFFMCLIASNSRLLKSAIMRGERKLFIEKITNATSENISDELLEATRSLSGFSQSEEFECISNELKEQADVLLEIMAEVVERAKHAFHKKHKNNCQKFQMNIPFTFMLDHVARREVNVVKGKVLLYCGDWASILLDSIFEHLLQIEIDFFEKYQPLQYLIHKAEDDRLCLIIEDCIAMMNGSEIKCSGAVTASSVDRIIHYFPPCMSNLHQILRKTHRLSHESRYQYTLFLKDIGMSCDESLKFWENEYSKENNCSSCTHDWEDNSRRYTYQIKHCYGLVGSRFVKDSHLCNKFTGSISSRMNGGCPFRHCSKSAVLSKLPEAFSSKDVKEIMKMIDANEPQRACAKYLESFRNCYFKNKCVGRKINEVYSPLQFYQFASQIHS